MPNLTPTRLLETVHRHLAAGRITSAILSARTAVHTAPHRADAWSALATAYTREHRWGAAQVAAQLAVRLDSTHRPAWIALGIAAKARGDNDTACQAWAALGLAPSPEAKHDAFDVENVQVHMMSELGPELVDAVRFGPATALLLGVPRPGTGRRCGDFVLLRDVVGQPYDMYGRPYLAFRDLAVLITSQRSTWHAVIQTTWEDELNDILQPKSWFDVNSQLWRGFVSPALKNPDGMDPLPGQGRTVHLGLSARKLDEVQAALGSWLADHPERVLRSLQLALPGQALMRQAHWSSTGTLA